MWSEHVKLTVNANSKAATEQNGSLTYCGGLNAGDTQVYAFAQKPRCVATLNRHAIAGHQKVYQDPLLLATEVKGGKPTTLSKEALDSHQRRYPDDLEWTIQTGSTAAGQGLA